jgi:hypothetical protein
VIDEDRRTLRVFGIALCSRLDTDQPGTLTDSRCESMRDGGRTVSNVLRNQ